MERIGFLGLGIMGSRMAANVARAGFPLTVYNRTASRAEAFAAEHGATVAATPAEAAARSDIVITMVVDGPQVHSLLLGDQGVAEGAHDGLLAIDMSTIAPEQTRAAAEGLASRGVKMLDAPVTGSSPRAQDGTLTIMVGGEDAVVARARPVLETMGSLVVHVGPIGQGEALKLVNNALAAANATAVAEALVLTRALGIDVDAMLDVTRSGSAASAMLELKADAMRQHDFAPLFKTDHMLKDVLLCLQQAQRAAVPFPSAEHALALLATASEQGRGQQDFAAIVESAERAAARTRTSET